MRLVKYIITSIVTLYIGFILFMPKEHLYYKVESILKEQGVVIGNEEMQSSLLDLKLLHPVIYYQGLDIARVSIFKFKPLLIINSLSAENIELLGVAKELNIEIDSIKANHIITKPYHIKVDIDANFGIASGYIDLKERVVHIDIVEPKDIKRLRRFLKKGQKGWFYESKF